jgi:sulfur carrier protein ThiS
MQIKVNGKAIEIFSGARVKDALRKFSRAECRLVQKNEKKVCDLHGHEIGLEGELNGGEEFIIKECAPESRP